MLGIMQLIDITFSNFKFNSKELEYLASKLLEKYSIEEVEGMDLRTLSRNLNKFYFQLRPREKGVVANGINRT